MLFGNRTIGQLYYITDGNVDRHQTFVSSFYSVIAPPSSQIIVLSTASYASYCKTLRHQLRLKLFSFPGIWMEIIISNPCLLDSCRKRRQNIGHRAPSHSRCGTIKIPPHVSANAQQMPYSEHFTHLHGQCWSTCQNEILKIRIRP